MKNVRINHDATTVRGMVKDLDLEQFKEKLFEIQKEMNDAAKSLEKEFKTILKKESESVTVDSSAVYSKLSYILEKVLQKFTKEEFAAMLASSMYDHLAQMVDNTFQKEILTYTVEKIRDNFETDLFETTSMLESFYNFLNGSFQDNKKDLSDKGLFYNSKNLIDDLMAWADKFSSAKDFFNFNSKDKDAIPLEKVEKLKELMSEIAKSTETVETKVEGLPGEIESFLVESDNSEEFMEIVNFMKKSSIMKEFEDGSNRMCFHSDEKGLDHLIQLLENYLEKKRKTKYNEDGNVNLDI